VDTTLFLGVDQSLNGTGLCLLTVEGVITYLETVRPGSRRGVERLAYVKSCVMALLTPNVKFVGIEGYAYDCVGRVFELGEVGGVLRLCIHESQLSYIDVAPACVKKFATRNAMAKKEAMVQAAVAAGAPVTDDNQADAFFLAMIARHVHTGIAPSTRAQMEVVYRLQNPPEKKPVRRIRTLTKNAL